MIKFLRTEGAALAVKGEICIYLRINKTVSIKTLSASLQKYSGYSEEKNE